jgi:hypothetical protein
MIYCLLDFEKLWLSNFQIFPDSEARKKDLLYIQQVDAFLKENTEKTNLRSKHIYKDNLLMIFNEMLISYRAVKSKIC